MASDEDTPAVPIVCPECSPRARVAIDDVADTVARHNKRLHGGDPVAGVGPRVIVVAVGRRDAADSLNVGDPNILGFTGRRTASTRKAVRPAL